MGLKGVDEGKDDLLLLPWEEIGFLPILYVGEIDKAICLLKIYKHSPSKLGESPSGSYSRRAISISRSI